MLHHGVVHHLLLGFHGLEILEGRFFLVLTDMGYVYAGSCLINPTFSCIFHIVLVECFEAIKKHFGNLLILLILLLLLVVFLLLNCLSRDLELLLSCFLSLDISCPDIEVPFVLLNSMMPEELLEMLLNSQFRLFKLSPLLRRHESKLVLSQLLGLIGFEVVEIGLKLCLRHWPVVIPFVLMGLF